MASLPTQTFLQSIMFTLIITPLTPDPRGFQQCHRRVAKLSHFFRVNYRDLFADVLESIEMGMQEELSTGSLTADEFEVCCRVFVLRDLWC
jgi:hypothetical protein